MLEDINCQLQELPNVIPVVNFLDPKFGPSFVPGEGPQRSPQPTRKLSQQHPTAARHTQDDLQVSTLHTE